jgi:transcriptional regulator with XRE-family HTH domain
MTVSETIRTAAISSGQTQKTMADATGVAQSSISRFLRGENVRSKELDLIAAHFGIVAKQSKKKKITVQSRLEGKSG